MAAAAPLTVDPWDQAAHARRSVRPATETVSAMGILMPTGRRASLNDSVACMSLSVASMMLRWQLAYVDASGFQFVKRKWLAEQPLRSPAHSRDNPANAVL